MKPAAVVICIVCKQPIEPSLATLGSVTCHDHRHDVASGTHHRKVA